MLTLCFLQLNGSDLTFVLYLHYRLKQNACLFFCFCMNVKCSSFWKSTGLKVGQKLSGQPADMQGSLLKMIRAEPKQEVVKVDSFSIFSLRCVFNFYLSFQMTGLDSHQTLQLAHRCAFFYVQTNPTLSTSVSVKPVQFPSFIYTQNFHVRQLSIQRKPDRHRDGERYRDKGLKRKLRVAGFIIEKKKL